MNDHLTDPAGKTPEPLSGNGSELKQLLGCRISECDDVEYLQNAVESLWQIIDDIDTFGDIVKNDNAHFRKLVEAKQKQRFEFTDIVTDGYFIYRKAVNIGGKDEAHN